VIRDKAIGEWAVFAEFTSTAGLPIRVDSVESRSPREPDIRCEVIGEGPVAFELGMVVNPALEQATNESANVRRQFQRLYENLAVDHRAAIERCLGHPPEVFVGFGHDASSGRWRQAVRPILGMLCDMAHARDEYRLCEGDLRFWRVPVLKDLLTDLSVRPSTRNEAVLGACEMVPSIDLTRDLLRKKFESHYQTDAPIELLVYYLSPFRRVWFYDHSSRAVPLVRPPVNWVRDSM
jgi:hypothetical protein